MQRAARSDFPPRTDPRSGRRALGAAAAIATLALFAAFAPTREAGFLQDDRPIVELNPIVARGDLREIFTTDYWGGVGGSETNLYRPVTIASFALERAAGGPIDPQHSHLLNVALHALASALLAFLVRRWGGGPIAALSAGTLFALHPVHVSVVAGLVGRAEILATLFTLSALLLQSAAGKWEAPGGGGPGGGAVATRLASWGAAGALFLALGSKEVAFAAPFLLVAMEALFRPPPSVGRRRWAIERAAALAPSALATVSFLALRVRALGVFPGTQRPRLSENPLVALEGMERLSTALGIAGRAAGLLVFPYPLSADYSGNVIRTYSSPFALLPAAGAVALGAAAAIAAAPLAAQLASRRGRDADLGSLRRLAMAALLFLIPYLAIGNLLVLVGVSFAERLLYLPSAGAAALAGMAFGRWAGGWRGGRAGAATAGVVAVGALLAYGSWRAARDYRSVETLFAAAVRATPESPRARFTLGKIRLDQGRTDEAHRLFAETVELWPRFSAAWLEKGRIEWSRGERAAAERSVLESVRANPWLDEGWQRLGEIRLVGGRPSDAARAYRRAVRLGRSDLLPRLREAELRASVGALAAP